MFRWITVIILSSLSLHVQAKSGVKGTTADYIVVGVGTAGAVMAGKLSADKKTSVIALHSGKNYTDSFILKYSQNMIFSVGQAFLGIPPSFNPDSYDLPPDLQKEFDALVQLINASTRKLYETGETIPQVNADDRQLSWVIAQPVGGASSLNAGAWVRGTNQMFAGWEAIAGENWSVNNIINTFKKLEDYDGKTTNKQARGYKGPLKITQDPPASELSKKFTEALTRATGTSFVLDYNDPNTPIGVASQMQSAHRGDNGFFRVSSVNAFLDEHAMNSKGKGVDGRKLQVYFGTTALKIIWNGNTAVGVQFLKNGSIQNVYARKGVIVCAGLGSSPFLLHSGVGPASLLNSLGIPVIYDNPNVGQGLVDQTPVPIVFATNPNDSNAGTTTVFAAMGNFSSPTGSPSGRQIRFAVVDPIPGITPVIVDLLQPQSRGSITLSSADPLVQPVIDFGLLSNPADLSLLVSTFQTYVKNLSQELSAIDPQYQLLLPTPEILDDSALVEAYIEAIAGTDFHYQGHCRMAPLDQGGVVDSNGKVYGVNNLYVADNSINPQPTDGSPMATAYLVAANIARLLGH